MKQHEAEDLVRQALELAMTRDGSSGGIVRLVTSSSGGSQTRLFQGKDIKQSWDE